MQIYVKNKRTSSKVKIRLKENRVNIVKLSFGEFVDDLPHSYFLDTKSKIIEGPKTYKIYVSNVNKRDITFRVLSDDSWNAEYIALAHYAYPTQKHVKSGNLLVRSKKPTPKDTNVITLHPNKHFGNIFRRPNHED